MGKKILLLTGLVFSALAIMISIGYFAGADISSRVRLHHTQQTSIYELPSVAVSMTTTGERVGTVHLGINLEVATSDLDKLESYTPRIMDKIQAYMQKASIDDLQRTPKLNWLRDDLLWEVNLASGPVRILRVDIRELLIA